MAKHTIFIYGFFVMYTAVIFFLSNTSYIAAGRTLLSGGLWCAPRRRCAPWRGCSDISSYTTVLARRGGGPPQLRGALFRTALSGPGAGVGPPDIILLIFLARALGWAPLWSHV